MFSCSFDGNLFLLSCCFKYLSSAIACSCRYKFLSASSHRLDFLQLQLQLLEDFRVRLVQLMRSEQEDPLQSNFCPILCTVHHLTTVLASWAETPFFLQLEQQRVQEEGGLELQGTVFDETIEKLEYLKSEMVSAIVEWVMFSVRSSSRGYRAEVKWWHLVKTETEVLPQACSMLQVRRALSKHRAKDDEVNINPGPVAGPVLPPGDGPEPAGRPSLLPALAETRIRAGSLPGGGTHPF